MTPDVLSELALAVDADQARHAARTVCGYATDTDDARTLLEALGLLDVLRKDEHRLAG